MLAHVTNQTDPFEGKFVVGLDAIERYLDRQNQRVDGGSREPWLGTSCMARSQTQPNVLARSAVQDRIGLARSRAEQRSSVSRKRSEDRARRKMG